MELNLIEQAMIRRVRFETTKGTFTTEDLIDLPLSSNSKPNLDDIAKELHKKVNLESMSFVSEKSANEIDKLKFDVVLRIIDIKKAANKEYESAKARKEQKELILSLIEKKKIDSLSNASIEELQQQLLKI